MVRYYFVVGLVRESFQTGPRKRNEKRSRLVEEKPATSANNARADA